jgi:hypothetical protein
MRKLFVIILLFMSLPNASLGLTLACKLESVLTSLRTNKYGSLDEKHLVRKNFTVTIEGNKCAWENGRFIYEATISEREMKCELYREEFNVQRTNGVFWHETTYLNRLVINRYSGVANKSMKDTIDSTMDGERSTSYKMEEATYKCRKTDKKF